MNYSALLKAAGSSLLAKLAGILVNDAIRMAGFLEVDSVIVLPLATGEKQSLLCVYSNNFPADGRLMNYFYLCTIVYRKFAQ